MDYSRNHMVVESPVMRGILAMAEKVADSDLTVILQGETGTGKELLANALYQASPRRENKFIAVDCTAFPQDTFENEMFGHEKGAFTGALPHKTGFLVEADGGTLFLDEIAELSLNHQAKLLRVLQERDFYPMGSSKKVRVDLRFIASTNAILKQRVKEGRFRDDLYHRLNVFKIVLPPLRERKEDILPLARYFLERAARYCPPKPLSAAAEYFLLNYRWPGNVRELENAIQRSLRLANGDEILPKDLGLDSAEEPDLPPLPEIYPTFAEWQKRYFAVLLPKFNNYTRAANAAGIKRTTLYRHIKKYGLDLCRSDRNNGYN